MQINMTGFLNGKNARQFMDELWALLLSAQESDMGIPSEFIQQKKDEILKREEDNKLLEQMKLDKESNDIDKSRDRGRLSTSKERQPSRSKSKSVSPIGVHNIVSNTSPEKQEKEVRRNSTDKLKVQRKSVDRTDRSKDRVKGSPPRPKSRGRSVDNKSKEQRPSEVPSKDRKDIKSKDRKKSPDRSKERNDKPRDRKRSRSRRRSKDRSPRVDRGGRSRDHRSRSRQQRSPDKSRDTERKRSSRSPRQRRRTKSRSVTPKSEARYRRSSPDRKDSKRMKSRSPLRQRKRSPSEQNGTKSSSGDITKIQAKLLNMADSNASKSGRSVSPVPADKPSLSGKRDKSASRSISK